MNLQSEFVKSCSAFCSLNQTCSYVVSSLGKNDLAPPLSDCPFFNTEKISDVCQLAWAARDKVKSLSIKDLIDQCRSFQELLNHDVDFSLDLPALGFRKGVAPFVLRTALAVGAVALLRFIVTPKRLKPFETPWT